MASGAGAFTNGLGCGARFVKFFLVFCNFIFFLLGLLIMAVGIYVLVDPKFSTFANLANVNVTVVAANNGVNLSYITKCGIAFCVFGGVMLIISFIGCCGALKNIRCLLGFYSVILAMVLLTEIGFGIYAGVFASNFKQNLSSVLLLSIKNDYMGDMPNKSITSVAWDAVQYNVHCCGVNNYTDFNQAGNVWSDRSNETMPRSCCSFTNYQTDWSGVIPTAGYTDPNCYMTPNLDNSYYATGCYSAIASIVSNYSSIVIGVAVGIGLFLVLGVVFAIYLCRKIDNDLDE